jgi:hypothetical protein
MDSSNLLLIANSFVLRTKDLESKLKTSVAILQSRESHIHQDLGGLDLGPHMTVYEQLCFISCSQGHSPVSQGWMLRVVTMLNL